METKKTKIIGIVALVALALTVVTATYAYFQAQVGDPAAVDISVNANTVDIFTFSVGDAISFSADQENFATGLASLSSTTTATATLTANNKTNSATENYYVYVNISNNTFTYSTEDSKPELILTVTGPDGTKVTDLDGLSHTTVTDNKGTSISGFDVTTTSGLITIANNKEIVAGTASAAGIATTNEEWTITLTFVNYNVDQSNNAGASLNAKVMIQKDSLPSTIADICISGQTLSSCIIAMNDKDENLYYHDENLEKGASDNSYRYAGGDSDYYICNYNGNDVLALNNTYDALNTECQTVYEAKLVDGNILYVTSEGLGISSETKQYDMSWNESKNACYDETNDKSFIDLYGNALTKEMCTGKSYREYGGLTLVGSGEFNKIEQTGVNNFVCFGSDADTCPTDNLYRIIGVFGNQVKLIKYDYATTAKLGGSGIGDYYGTYSYDSSTYKGSNYSNIASYYWNYKATNDQSNTWSTSLLNKTNLNTNFITYLNNINTKWANMIAETTWKVGGNTEENIRYVTPATAYANEITSPKIGDYSTDNATTYPAKIGLMYVSDYGYAASSSAWSTTLNSYWDVTSVNWMYMGLFEWTISRDSDSSGSAFEMAPNGRVYSVGVDDCIAVRPVFYLVPTATYSSGTGTSTDPIILGD